MRLDDRVILIAGAASGIGAATARRFHAEGARMALADRDVGGLARLAAELDALAVPLDITDEAAVGAAIAAVLDRFGALDGLVHAAGVGQLDNVQATSADDWRRTVDIDLTGAYLVCRAALPHLMRCGASVPGGATIVMLSSTAGLMPGNGGAAYAAAKAGLLMLSKNLAREAAPHVRVNAICPGLIDTPMVHAMFPQDRERHYAAFAAQALLQRVGRPEEIAAAALFLSSAEASYITGVTLAVDGGKTFH